MAKRGRKPKERKGYFYEKEETAIIQYIHEENIEEKNRIFNTVIYPALTKMIESIIRRYKLFVPDEDFDQNFNDTISYLLTKINHFKPQITGYTLIENEKEIDVAIQTNEDGIVYINFGFFPEYFMGDPSASDYQAPSPNLFMIYNDSTEESLNITSDEEEILQYGVRLISYEYADPIENSFKEELTFGRFEPSIN